MLWIIVFMLFLLLWLIPHLICFRTSLAFFMTVTLAAGSPELMPLGPPATFSSKVAETAEFQHCEIKFCCISTPLVQDKALVSLFGVSVSPCHGSLSQCFVHHQYLSIFMSINS